MFRKNTWPNVRVTEVEVAFHSFGYRAPHRCQLCLYCVPSTKTLGVHASSPVFPAPTEARRLVERFEWH
jgi:hypothetical protein